MTSLQTFEVLILGSSAATPTSTRNPTAQLLNVAERFFLIDCGEGTQIQMRRYKTRFQSINHVFISHLHGDHFLGLPGFLASMHLLGRKNELVVYGPAELEEIVNLIHKHSDTYLGYPLRFVATQNEHKELLWEDDKVEVYSFPLQHRVRTTGFLFREKPLPRNINKYRLEKLDVSFAEIHKLKKGLDATDNQGRLIRNEELTLEPPAPRSYAFCSDTRFFPELAGYIRDVDLLYHEATFLEDRADRAAVTYHSTASQAATMATMANARQLLLGHFSARYTGLDEFLREAQPLFANVSLATEGRVISL